MSRMGEPHKIVVMGDSGTGKTYSIIRLLRGAGAADVYQYDFGIEDSYRADAVVDGTTYHLDILDTTGMEEYMAIRGQWVEEAEVILLFYRVDVRHTFDYCTEYWNGWVVPYSDDHPPPTILVGNRCDASDNDREVSYEEGEALARELGVTCFCETSALQGTGITELYNQAAVLSARARASKSNGRDPAYKKPCRIM